MVEKDNCIYLRLGKFKDIKRPYSA